VNKQEDRRGFANLQSVVLIKSLGFSLPPLTVFVALISIDLLALSRSQ
jgi:hypothetical protein